MAAVIRSSASATSTIMNRAGTMVTAAVAVGLIGLCSHLARGRRRRRHRPPPVTLAQRRELAAITAVPVTQQMARWSKSFPNVKFNPSFFAKLEAIRQNGRSKLVTIADFDWTLTGFHNEKGVLCKTSYGVLTSSPLVDEKYRDRAAEIKAKYFPYERDYTITTERKHELMVEWWNTVHEAMVAYPFTKTLVHDSIRHAVETNCLFLREGTSTFLASLERANIPLLVMSAGMHQTVEQTLRMKGLLHPTTEVCANTMGFADDGKCVSFTPVHPVHSGNKSFTSVPAQSGFRAECRARSMKDEAGPNVLLLGDSMGDIHMTRGLAASTVLSIGFLNDDIEKRLPEFMGSYDAVICHDGNMDLPLQILEMLSSDSSAATSRST